MESLNEREDYLDRLLRGVEGGPEEEIPETEDEFLGEFGNSFSQEDENEFLQAFERSKKRSDRDDTDSDKSFDMEDIDHIVDNVKNNALNDFEDFGDLYDENDLPMEESLLNFSEEDKELDEIETNFEADHPDDYVVNTTGTAANEEEQSEGTSEESLDTFSNLGEENQEDTLQQEDFQPKEELPEDELTTMAKELAMEIDELGLGSNEEVSQEESKEHLEESEKSQKDEKNKKLGFFKRLSIALFGEEEESLENTNDTLPEINEIDNISDENIEILKELENKKNTPVEDEKAKKAKKKKEQAEKKAQKKKEKAEKKAQKQQAKQAKPKKEKKVKPPKVVEKTKPLPKGPVRMIVLVVASLVILIYLASNQIEYSNSIAAAKKYYEEGNYVEAYTCFGQGKKIKAADEELYTKAKLTAYVQQQIKNYKMYQKQDMYSEALSSLICGIGRYDINVSDAVEAGAAIEYDKMLADLEKALDKNYKMTLDKARELYDIREKEDYTYALYDIIEDLGLLEE